MHVILSIVLIGTTVFATEFLVETWLGEDRRFWVGLAGFALLLVAGALVKASGINALTRQLRNAVIGAGVGAALTRTGLRLPWLRSGLRLFGVETERQERTGEAPRASGVSAWPLTLGWAGSLVGLGFIWTGVLAG